MCEQNKYEPKKCHVCGGDMKRVIMTRAFNVPGVGLIVFTGCPVYICGVCGAEVVTAEEAQRIDKQIRQDAAKRGVRFGGAKEVLVHDAEKPNRPNEAEEAAKAVAKVTKGKLASELHFITQAALRGNAETIAELVCAWVDRFADKYGADAKDLANMVAEGIKRKAGCACCKEGEAPKATQSAHPNCKCSVEASGVAASNIMNRFMRVD